MRRWHFCAIAALGVLLASRPSIATKCTCTCGNGEHVGASDANSCSNLCTHANKGGGFWHCPPPPKRAEVMVYPKYQVIALEYVPPGDGSSVEYSHSTTRGSKIDLKQSFKSGIHIAIEGNVTVDGEYLVGTSSGQSFEFETEEGRKRGLEGRTDTVDHEKDQFLIWLNPSVDLNLVDNNITATFGTRDDAKPDVVSLTVAELKNPATIPDKKRAKLDKKGFTKSDYANILALDPLADSDATDDPTTVDPKRYAYVDQIDLIGSDHPDDGIQQGGIEISSKDASGISVGVSESSSVEIGTKEGAKLFGLIGEEMTVAGKMEYEFEGSTEATAGEAASASVMLETKSPQYTNAIDVYYDQLFKVFAFRQELPPAGAARSAHVHPPTGAVVGRITGKNTGGMHVDLIGPDGLVRHSVADAKGTVHFVCLKSGRYSVYFGGHKMRTVDVSDGKESAFTAHVIVLNH